MNISDIFDDFVLPLIGIGVGIFFGAMISTMLMSEHVKTQCDLRGYDWGDSGPYGIDAYCERHDFNGKDIYVPWKEAKKSPVPRECLRTDQNGLRLMAPC